MRKLFLTFIIFMTFSANSTFAQSSITKTLDRIENSLFGIEYTKQSDNQRLERIEESIYGEKKSGNIKTRLENLSKDVATNQMGQEIKPKRDTFEEEPEIYTEEHRLAQSEPQNYYAPEEKAEPNIDYPIINELEEQTFGKSYKDLDLNSRLEKLEKHALRKTYNDALSDRVERLKNKLAYTPSKQSQYDYDDGNYYTPQSDNYYDYNDNYFSPQSVAQADQNFYHRQQNDNQYIEKELSDRDFRSKLNKMEKNVFKQSFSNDNVENRLSRLESTMFNTNFSNDKNSTRLNRISSAVQAQKSAKKYDSNSFQQKMGTALQIGMFVLMVVAMIL